MNDENTQDPVVEAPPAAAAPVAEVKLIRMVKIGPNETAEQIEVHPDAVKSHESVGWEVSELPATEVLDEKAEALASRQKKTFRR
jgi:hypothetical protein